MDFIGSSPPPFSPLSASGAELSVEQMQWLLNSLSSEDRDMVSKELKSCATEVTLTRGLPISAALIGSVIFARKRLPQNLQVGPRGWPLYVLLGFGTLSLTNLITANKCNQRIRPIMSQLYEKYNTGVHSSRTYEALRAANRGGTPAGGRPQDEELLSAKETKRHDYQYQVPAAKPPRLYTPATSEYGGVGGGSRFSTEHQDDDVPLMSGTPYSSVLTGDQPLSSTFDGTSSDYTASTSLPSSLGYDGGESGRGSRRYGDEGFS